jgi:hypothetical protein
VTQGHSSLPTFGRPTAHLKEAEALTQVVLARAGEPVDSARLADTLARRDIDLAALLGLCVFHRTEAYLYDYLASHDLVGIFPGKWLIALNQTYELNALRASRFAQIAAQLSASFELASIEHAFIKGLSTPLRLGWPPGLKQLNDLDLLVHPADIRNVVAIMLKSHFEYGEYDLLGREIRAVTPEELEPYEREPHKYHHLRHPFCARLPDVPGSVARVEIHVSCGWRCMPERSLDTNRLIASSRSFTFGDVSFRALADDAEFCVLSLQLYHDLFALWDVAVRHKDFELSRLAEILGLVRLYPMGGFPQWGTTSETIAAAIRTAHALIALFTNPTLQLTSVCPPELSRYGLSTDGAEGTFDCTIYDRFLSPVFRRQHFPLDTVKREAQRRVGFWSHAERKSDRPESL